MNDNLIDWIDNHWDVIRNSALTYDMNKFKQHVTTEINSLGIFSLTINATLMISMVCISNIPIQNKIQPQTISNLQLHVGIVVYSECCIE